MIRSMSFAAAALVGLTSMLSAQEAPARLDTKSGSLHGTLLLPPNASGQMPVALIIAGSGPTDRDGNSPLLAGKNNSLKLVAEALAQLGVASVRYDKRGIAGSVAAGSKESDLRFTTYVDDAVDWLEWLRKDARFSRRIVVGHSEGSLIGMLAAQRSPVSHVVSLAGAGRAIAEVLDDQLSRGLPPELLTDARRILGELKAGRTVDSVPAPLMALFRPSVQPYMISWLPIDPAREAGHLTMPLLLVQGTTDLQVSVADAERLATGNPRAVLAVVDGMNHILKEVREASQQTAAYSDPSLPLHPALVEALSRFVGHQP
jgi:alpha-beta hydrolase superfamily lysophospholipase